MIFLKTEKGHEKLSGWEDVIRRPNFSEQIEKTGHSLSHIIGYYRFPDKLHCGLKGCNQPHNKGYIVVTTDGTESNIGKDCGKGIFGVEFGDHATEFDKYRKNEERKIYIQDAKVKLDEWRTSLESLKERRKNILWVNNCLEALLNATKVGRTGAMEMRSIARTQDPNVKIDVKVTDLRLRELLYKFNKTFRDSGQALDIKVIGKVSNLHVLLSENSLKVMFTSVMDNIKAVQNCDENSVPSPVLADISQKANALQGDVDRIHTIFADAKAFLTKKNLSPVLKKLQEMDSTPEADRTSFASFINKF